jgi:hypothetical protein
MPIRVTAKRARKKKTMTTTRSQIRPAHARRSHKCTARHLPQQRHPPPLTKGAMKKRRSKYRLRHSQAGGVQNRCWETTMRTMTTTIRSLHTIPTRHPRDKS